MTWIVGFFYFNDRSGFQPIELSGGVNPGFDYRSGLTTLSTQSYAGFGQATATILPNTHLTAGLRYTIDKRDFEAGSISKPTGGSLTGFLIAANSPQSKTWSKLTGRISVDRNFTDDVMGYIGYNRGFKSGTFNAAVSAGASVDPPLDPETLDSYTIGLKSEYLDHRIRLNLEGFYYSYKNIQLRQIVAGITRLTNAAKASVKGIDIDLTLKPSNNFTLTASAEIMDGQYDSFPNGIYYVYRAVPGGNCTFTVVPGGPAPCNAATLGVLPPNYNPVTGTWDLRGNKTLQTPPFSISLTGNYTIPSSIGQIDLNLSWTHTAHYFSDADNGLGQAAPSSVNVARQKALDLLNGSFGWISTNGRWDARLWAKNITNVEYWAFATEGGLLNNQSPAPPRTFGISVTSHL